MKRIFWFGIGAAAGAGSTVWAERKVRSQIEALSPDQLVVRATKRAGQAGRNIIDAVTDGRDAMRTREDELRTRYQARHPNDQVRAGEHYRPRSVP
ncbi:MAG: hypothetical protein V9F03_03985 [Microthrixaceae bacterium]